MEGQQLPLQDRKRELGGADGVGRGRRGWGQRVLCPECSQKRVVIGKFRIP